MLGLLALAHVDFMLFVSISFALGSQCENAVFGGIWANEVCSFSN